MDWIRFELRVPSYVLPNLRLVSQTAYIVLLPCFGCRSSTSSINNFVRMSQATLNASIGLNTRNT